MIETKTAEKIHYEIADSLSKGVSYIDALIDYANRENVEIETIAEIVKRSPVIKEKIRSEAVKLRMVKKDKDVNTICD